MAVVEWIESEQRTGRDNKSHTVSTIYRSTQELINQKINLFYQHGNTIDMLGGEYVYPFTYTLPPDLPSTYKVSSIGKVIYIIKGYVDRSFKLDYKAETEINVVEVLDLNRYPNLLMPADIHKQKTVGCLCWRSGPVDMSLNIPYTGLVPGQNVPIALRIENLSRITISAVRFDVLQRITYHSNTPSKKSRSDTNRITSMKDTGVGAHGERTYDLHLQIPSSFIPLNLKTCYIIDVVYSLNVEVVIPGLHRNMNEGILIEVGNVALIDTGYRIQQYPPVLSLVEPEADIVGETDGFAIVGPNVNPSAPPTMPVPYIPNISIAPVMPSAPPPCVEGNAQTHPGIGWVNPTADDSAHPPPYNDLFDMKRKE